MRPSLLFALLLAACTTDVHVTRTETDADADGYSVDIDCDDTRKTVNPDAPELCDGLDNDCDGTIDDAADGAVTWYADADHDGYGDLAEAIVACDAPDGYVTDPTDCDDTQGEVHPTHPEVCDGLDNDCDGRVDLDAVDATTWGADGDGDGYGDAADTQTACDAPAGYAAGTEDCDDGDAAIHPGASESDCSDPVDYNCDGSVEWADADGDGWAACEDCDDLDGTRSPSLPEVCDEADVDEDCSLAADDADAGLDESTASTWSRDADGDGYGAGLTLVQCEQPTGYVLGAGDCDDTDGSVNPGGLEVCDALDTDEDCSGAADDLDAGVDPTTWSVWYVDADSDSWGTVDRSVSQCDAPAGFVGRSGDCDDADAAISPDGTEVCDELDADEDCDGVADEDDYSVTGLVTSWTDADADGYGDASSSTEECSVPSGYVENDDDCDDTTALRSPALGEACDAADLDEDCDGLADDADVSASGTSTTWPDDDGDGYGDASAPLTACDPPSDHVSDDDDCDDTDAAISPAEAEVCDDGLDNDCDGSTDEDCASCGGPTTISTYNYGGMHYYPLDFDDCLPTHGTIQCCSPTTTQDQMDAFCQLAGYCEATSWVEQTISGSTDCYCWGSCSGYTWTASCCSGSETRRFVTEVTCE